MQIRSVAIIGAGLAGLACARTLAAHDIGARLFDQGRAAGGRLATHRAQVEGETFFFDHGAQYLTARNPLFRAILSASRTEAWPAEDRHVGVPRMAVIGRDLANGLDLTPQREVVELAGEPGAWRLRHLAARRRGEAEGPAEESGPFDAVALAIPAPLAAGLLQGPAPHLAGVLENVQMAPCWTLMAAFAGRVNLPDTVRLSDDAITWAARDSSKPGRDGMQECWVVQAGPTWSRKMLEERAEDVAALLMTAFAALAGGRLPAVRYKAAYCWRHALVETPLGAPCLWDPAMRLGAAGDWCTAARAEAAAESGTALATVMTKAA